MEEDRPAGGVGAGELGLSPVNLEREKWTAAPENLALEKLTGPPENPA